MKKCLLFTFYFLLFTIISKAQLLFYQDVYRGGVTSDGRTYVGYDYLQPDTVSFQLHIPNTASVKKAFLISKGILWYGSTSSVDRPLYVNFNGNTIKIDSSCRATNFYYTGGDYLWGVQVDVTNYIQNTSNKLIVPCQSCLLSADTTRHFVYDGFLLVVMYQKPSYPIVNPVIFLNNTPYATNKNYTLFGMNKINTANDVGLSVYTVDPDKDSITVNILSSLGNNYLGSIGINQTSGIPDSVYHYAPGSFYYENNTLFGLKDDNPNNGFDTTDALVDIKNYISNNTQSFVLNITASIFLGTHDLGYDEIDAFVLAYSTPCPARSNKDTTTIYNICSSSSVQLNGTSIGTYTWSAPSNSLSSYSIPKPIASPTVTTTYIALVDSAGCKHTEQYHVDVYTTPKADSVKTTVGICGSTAGTATIMANVGSPTSYTVNGMVQSSPSYTNLAAGSYTFALSNNFGCTYISPKPFVIKDTNLAKANFYLSPGSGCQPLSISCTNISNYGGNLSNAYTWYVNNDSAITTNFNYTFTDTGMYTITLFAYETLRKCSATATQTLLVKDCPPDSINITVPNIFSPNADGINDTWQVAVYNYQFTVNNYQCTIYDRWGIKVFETNDVSSSPAGRLGGAWDGRTTSGMPSSAGTYYYLIKLRATNSKGKSQDKEFKGFLELVR